MTPEYARMVLKLSRIRRLAMKWDTATNLSDGTPNIVAKAFAQELFTALGDRGSSNNER